LTEKIKSYKIKKIFLKRGDNVNKIYINFILIFILFFSFLILTNCSKKSEKSVEQAVSEEEITKKEPQKKLIFGRVPADNVENVLKQMTPLRKYLEEKLKADVQIKFASDYEKVSDNLKDKYHIAILGPVAYVHASAKFQCKPLVKPIRRGKSTYEGMIIVHKDSKIKKVEELKGKKIAFVDPESTSGYIFPLYVLEKAGLKKDVDFTVSFLKGHDNVVLNVLKKKYDAGACYFDARTSTLKNNPEQINDLVIISTTPPISNDPIVAGPLLLKDEQFLQEVKNAFLELNNYPDKNRIFESLTGEISGYDEAKDEDYNVIREFLKNK